MVLIVLVFLLGVGVVLGVFFAITKLPGYLAQRQLNSRLNEITSIRDEGPADGATARTSSPSRRG